MLARYLLVIIGMKSKCMDNNGFTLLELLIAIFILAVGLMGTASLMVSGISGNRLSSMVTVEGGIAHSVVDEFMARDSGDAVFNAAVVDAVYDLDSSSAATTRVVQNVTYSVLYSITPNNPVTGMVRLDITITGGGRTLSMTSFKRSI